jgi:hypothetical protein
MEVNGLVFGWSKGFDRSGRMKFRTFDFIYSCEELYRLIEGIIIS